MRAIPVAFASLCVVTVASVAYAQIPPIEKCTGNFEEAQLKEKRGRLVEAEQLYAACADPMCPSMIRADCATKRDETTRRIPTFTIVVRDSSGNDVKAYVEIDGKPLLERTHAQPMDPGEHTVNYRVEGMTPVLQKITLVEGEKARVITLTATATEGKAKADPAAPPPTIVEGERGPAIVGPAILVTAGVILLGVGVALQIIAKNDSVKADELRAEAESPTTDSGRRGALLAASASRDDSARANQLFAVVTGVGGVLFIGGGVTWYLVTRPSAAKRSSLTPVIAPGFAGVSYGVQF